MISSKRVKRTFKIFLDSNNTASFTGAQFNANFYIDLTHIIFDNEAFNKSYYMSFNFQSKSALTTNSTIQNDRVYSLHIDMGKGLNIFQYRQVKNPAGLLQIVNDFTSYTTAGGVTSVPIYWNTKETDNKPVFIQNIRDISQITLNVIDTQTNTTFNGADDQTINSYTKYVCVLTFEEA
jgi:hypothetical protein